MKKLDAVRYLLGDRSYQPSSEAVTVFAPVNIALCKYWGKRDLELNLPRTSSLSISLDNKGATTTLSVMDAMEDHIVLNGQVVHPDSSFNKRVTEYLDLFRQFSPIHFHVDIISTIPIAAGLASSACGFASLAMALNKLFDWKLDTRALSILARLGSGSACRSIEYGFIEWHAGQRSDGMDSFGESIHIHWPEFCIGLLCFDVTEKKISSREAMRRTVETSDLYAVWPDKVHKDLRLIKEAIQTRHFTLLGQTAESNALAMHATILSAWPPVSYSSPDTVQAMQKIWDLRHQGLDLYFTQDAGPNLKLLFLKKDAAVVQQYFPTVSVLSE